MSRNSQDAFYTAQTFELAEAAVTYTAAGLASAKYTAGVTYYARLDAGAIGNLNGFISALWSPGSGTAGTVYFGLYQAVPGSNGGANGTLYQLASTASEGAVTAALIRKQLLQVGSSTVNFASTAFLPSGNPIGGENTGVFYGALLVATDAATNHVDCATSTAWAANTQISAGANLDPTGSGAFPRCFTGAGTALTKLPMSEAISGVTTSVLLPWLAID